MQPGNLVRVEHEVQDGVDDALSAGHNAEAVVAGERTPECLEDSLTTGGTVAEGCVKHGELVAVGVE